MRRIFTYRNDMVDLDKVSAIEFDEGEVIFHMDSDWDYTITLKQEDTERVKKELAQLYNQ